MANYNNTYVLKLDVKEQQPNPVIRIVQNDSVYLNIELYDAGRKMEIEQGDRFVVSVEHEATGTRSSGLASYDGSQFVVYNFKRSDMKYAGTWKARFAVYKDAQRVSSLVFRYEVYEDMTSTGNAEDGSLMEDLFLEVQEIGSVAQRQGEYAEDRGDYANAAGVNANKAAESNMMDWLPYVKTIAERNSFYPNPKNGDVLYVINDNKVYRFDAINSMDWEAIAGWDTSVIQDIYNVKADKSQMDAAVKKVEDNLAALSIGGRNILSKTEFNEDMAFKSASTGFTMSTNKDLKLLTIAKSGSYSTGSTYSLPLEKDVESGTWVNVSFWAKTGAMGGTYKFRIGNGSYSPIYNLGDASSYKFYTFRHKADHSSDGSTIYIEHTQSLEIKGSTFKIEQGDRPTAWTPSIEDINRRIQSVRDELTTVSSTVTGHGSRISAVENELATNVVKKSVLDTSVTNLEKKVSAIQQTADGITSTVTKKVGAEEVKSIINQSAEGVKIKASNIDFDGVTTFVKTNNVIDPQSFLKIEGGTLTMQGKYNRVWRDGIKRDRVQTIQFVEGMMRITDPKGDFIDDRDLKFWNDHDSKTARSIYYTSDGISTYRDGSGKYTTGDGSGTGEYVASGTIEFFSHEYSDVRGITMMSANGAVGLHANNHNAVIHAGNIVYNRSKKSIICLQPHKDVRNGNNNFIFGVNSNLSGYLTYGDNSTNVGSGLLFSKTSSNPVVTVVDGGGNPSASVGLSTGKLLADVITDRAGKKSVYFNGQGGVTLTASDSLTAGGIVTNSNNFYIGTASEVRVTNKNGYNNGNKIGYLPIRASSFLVSSSRKYKTNIEDLEVDTLKLVKESKVRQYNLKTDLERGVDKTKYGVIVEDVNEVLHDGDAVDTYTMSALHWDATQKLIGIVEKQEEYIKQLEARLEKLENQ